MIIKRCHIKAMRDAIKRLDCLILNADDVLICFELRKERALLSTVLEDIELRYARDRAYFKNN